MHLLLSSLSKKQRMKKIILFAIFTTVSSTVFAQIGDDIKFGFRTGLNYSTLSANNLDNPESRYGLHVGFFAEIPINDCLSLVPELGLSALGVNEPEIRSASGAVVDLKTNWLQVSVLAKINLNQHLYLQVGPQVGVNVIQKGDDDLYNYDFSAVGGVGYMFNQNAGVDLRYGYGFSNIYDNAFEVNNEASNRYVQLGFSYRL
jgi:hypothetical protein